MPPMPSEPASIPTRMNSRTIGTPIRWEARLDSTLAAISAPAVARSRAVPNGSVVGMAGVYFAHEPRELHRRPGHDRDRDHRVLAAVGGGGTDRPAAGGDLP